MKRARAAEAAHVRPRDQLAVADDQRLVQVQPLPQRRQVRQVAAGVGRVAVRHVIPQRNCSVRRHAERQRQLLARGGLLARVAVGDPGQRPPVHLGRHLLIGPLEGQARDVAVDLLQADSVRLRAREHDSRPDIGQVGVQFIERPADAIVVERLRRHAVDFFDRLALGPAIDLADRRRAQGESIQDQHLDHVTRRYLALLARRRPPVDGLGHPQPPQVRVRQRQRPDRLADGLHHLDSHGHLPHEVVTTLYLSITPGMGAENESRRSRVRSARSWGMWLGQTELVLAPQVGRNAV